MRRQWLRRIWTPGTSNASTPGPSKNFWLHTTSTTQWALSCRPWEFQLTKNCSRLRNQRRSSNLGRKNWSHRAIMAFFCCSVKYQEGAIRMKELDINLFPFSSSQVLFRFPEGFWLKLLGYKYKYPENKSFWKGWKDRTFFPLLSLLTSTSARAVFRLLSSFYEPSRFEYPGECLWDLVLPILDLCCPYTSISQRTSVL